VLALRRGDVLLEKVQLRVERQVVEVAGEGARITEPKAGSRRTVALPGPALEALQQHLESLPPGLPAAPLFMHWDATMLRAHHVHYAWKHARDEAGLPDAHFHDLRHAGLTLSAQAGATLAEVMRRAGHSSAAAALRYQHAADQRDAEIAARLSALADRRKTGGPDGATTGMDVGG
jgi:integrase